MRKIKLPLEVEVELADGGSAVYSSKLDQGQSEVDAAATGLIASLTGREIVDTVQLRKAVAAANLHELLISAGVRQSAKTDPQKHEAAKGDPPAGEKAGK